jgi:hypothetical protein
MSKGFDIHEMVRFLVWAMDERGAIVRITGFSGDTIAAVVKGDVQYRVAFELSAGRVYSTEPSLTPLSAGDPSAWRTALGADA